MGELVRGPDDEGIERVARIETGRRRDWRRDQRFVVGHDLVHDRHDPAIGSCCGGAGTIGDFLAFRDERHDGGRTVELGERLVEDRGVVLGQPVAEKSVGDTHENRAALVGDEGGRFEPGVEAVPVDLGLDPRQDLVPDIRHRSAGHRRGHCHGLSPPQNGRNLHVSYADVTANARRDKAVTPFAMAKYQPKGVPARMVDLEIRGFPQFFPQVWKTLGGTPNWSRSVRARIRVRQTAECSTRRPRRASESGRFFLPSQLTA